jgi:hypothetical protein
VAESAIDFQIINFTRPEGGDNTGSISPTDNAVKLFKWKSIRYRTFAIVHYGCMSDALHIQPQDACNF